MTKRFSVYHDGALVTGFYMAEEENPFFKTLTYAKPIEDLEVDKFGIWATDISGKKYYVIRDTDKG
jgi:hypothetical protein